MCGEVVGEVNTGLAGADHAEGVALLVAVM
jgi:hypothetical protein